MSKKKKRKEGKKADGKINEMREGNDWKSVGDDNQERDRERE